MENGDPKETGEEQLRRSLIEGYKATREEDARIDQEWESATLDGWPDL